MKNSRREITRYLRRFADENGISITALSDDWIFVLERGAIRHVVFGYDLGLNPSTAHRIANDKAATFEILAAEKVPALPHVVFMHPRYAEHLSYDGNWTRMLATFEEWRRDTVVKPNEGTGGLQVSRVRTNFELERAVQSILSDERSVAMSPYMTIDREIRLFVLNGEAVLGYEKKVPAVTGDGSSTLAHLIARQTGSGIKARNFGDLNSIPLDLGRIPAAGEHVLLHWKHNLSQGARAEFLTLSLHGAAVALAVQAARCIGLRFCTVDLIETGGALMVLEVNSGVMMESIVRQQANGDDLLDRIYGAALAQIFPARRGA
jgi:glutathione synthase/RimK-type ligase-like ATP-grasp enzyme